MTITVIYFFCSSILLGSLLTLFRFTELHPWSIPDWKTLHLQHLNCSHSHSTPTFSVSHWIEEIAQLKILVALLHNFYLPPPFHIEKRESVSGFQGQGQATCFCILNKHDPCGFSQGEAFKKKREKEKGSQQQQQQWYLRLDKKRRGELSERGGRSAIQSHSDLHSLKIAQS